MDYIEEYLRVPPLFVVEGGSASREKVMRQQAQAALAGAIVTAASHGNLEVSNIPKAIALIRMEGLLGRHQVKLLRQTVQLIRN